MSKKRTKKDKLHDRDSFLTAIAVIDVATREGEVSRYDIASELGCHSRTALRTIQKLVDAGWLYRTTRMGRNGETLYRAGVRINPTPRRSVMVAG